MATGLVASQGGAEAPLVSILVPLFRHAELAAAMFESLQASLPAGLSHEILLLDDASEDSALNVWLDSVRSRGCRILVNSSNLGFAGTNNRGAREAKGHYLALLNSDLQLEPGWLEPMLSVFERRGQRVGLVGNLQHRLSDGSLDHAGISADPRGKLVHLRDLPPGEDREVFAVTAACCLVRREDFLAVDGFDEAYRNGGEDVDLALKLRARGQASFVALRSQVGHHVSASRGASSLQDEKNSRLLYSKWKAELTGELCRVLMERGETAEAKARLLATSALWREQCRWEELLDAAAPETPQFLVLEKGIRQSAPGSASYICGRASLSLPRGLPRRSLVLNGYLEPLEKAGRHPGLELCINGLQTLQVESPQPGPFHLVVPDPAALPDRDTLVELRLTGLKFWQRFPRLLEVLALLPGGLGRSISAYRSRRYYKQVRLLSLVCDDRLEHRFDRA